MKLLVFKYRSRHLNEARQEDCFWFYSTVRWNLFDLSLDASLEHRAVAWRCYHRAFIHKTPVSIQPWGVENND